MKKFLMALAVLALVSAPAFAGPNAFGTLVVHDTGLVLSIDPGQAYPSPAPECAGLDSEIALGAPSAAPGYVFKVYAAFPQGASPRLKALAFGATFPANVIVVEGGVPDANLDFEISQGGWPQASGGGVGISLGTTGTALMNEVYWLGAYAYDSPAAWSLAPHPSQTMVFVDDSVPPQEDPIAGLSSIGFGVAGETICPTEQPTEGACCIDYVCYILTLDACVGQGGTFIGGECIPGICGEPPVLGACCLPTGECIFVREAECIAAGGAWYENVPCDPYPCPTPVEETSWGQIKANYR